MTNSIDQEIERLLKIKEEVDKVNKLKKEVANVLVVSQLMYDHLSSKGLLKQDTFYYIVSREVGLWIEGYRG